MSESAPEPLRAPARVTPLGAARFAIVGPDPSEELYLRIASLADALGEPSPAILTLAWELSAGSELATREARFLLALAVLIAEDRGSTRLRVEGPAGALHLEAHLGALLGLPAARAERVAALQAHFASEAEWVSPGLCREGPYLRTPRLAASEARLAAAFLDRAASSPTPELDAAAAEAALTSVLDRPPTTPLGPLRLAEEQAEALRQALARPLCVISGGPGTGKTSLVVALLRALALLGLDAEELALAAPTGKAAQRLQGSIAAGLATVADLTPAEAALQRAAPAALTIHRLLGLSQRRSQPRHHRGNPLSAAVVIVDEASMISLPLMERLVAAIRPGARLVLLGDADQLPAVGAGTVLQEVLACSGEGSPLAGCGTRLVHNFRQDASDPAGAQLLRFAGDLREERDPHAALTLAEAGVQPSGPVARWSSPGDPDLERLLADAWAWWFAPLAEAAREGFAPSGGGRLLATPSLEALFAQAEAARLLCLTRTGPRGADALNERLRRRAGARGRFAPGAPILVHKNDYELGLVNGEVGLALWVEEPAGPRLRAVFRQEGQFRALPLELFGDRLSDCYAMTVHKAQGSEYDHVALVLPGRDLPLLCRELIYTAVTRARRSVTLAGQRELFEFGVGRTLERESGLGDALRG